MAWPYQFLSLTDAEKHLRRQSLNEHATYAQLSALLPVALFLLVRITAWAIDKAKSRRGAYAAIPNSPALKSRRQTGAGAFAARAAKVQWWLGGDVWLFGSVWGQRDQWVLGVAWALWLALLCVAGTGNDYLHLTKRFGIVAASQYPVQYLLALKSLNPFAYAFRSSHEHVNRYHRVLGRIIYGLLLLHASFYTNYFVQTGILRARLTAPVVALGATAFFGLTILNTTALRAIRQYSYRLFFVTHLIVALAMPVVLFFHARPAATFMAEAFLVFIADLVSRKIDTFTAQTTVEPIPGTNLVKISASIPYNKANRFRQHPGSHVYVSLPPAARAKTDSTLFEFVFNPFTVASVGEGTGDLMLVARQLGGPMTTALGRFASRAKSGIRDDAAAYDEAKVPLNLEGPYGVATYFPHLSSGEFDRVLLVAGGVGATFTVPLYRSIVHDNPSTKVEMVWAVRGAGDATWAVSSNETRGILDDDNVHIFLTGDMLDAGSSTPTANSAKTRSQTRGGGGGGTTEASSAAELTDGEVEMSPMYRDRRRNRYTSQHSRKRPDLRKIVDDLFRHGAEERVAILVCGPSDMARELRDHVGVWVMKGRSVWFHNEAFGW